MTYATVREAIAEAARAANRLPADVDLTAVSKQQPWDRVARVLAAGHRRFGENRVEEAARRWSEHRPIVELRLIGRLQSNKVAAAVALFDVIETVDRPRLVEVLAREMDRQGRMVRLYIQINTGEEPQKGGVPPKEADAFIANCRRRQALAIEGLMCLPPAHEPPAAHFALLAKIAARNGLERLSMGMSGDFRTAIRFGATSVRIGAALFGERPDPELAGAPVIRP